VAAHGSPYCREYGYRNNYIFREFYPDDNYVMKNGKKIKIKKISLDEFGLEYEAYHLNYRSLLNVDEKKRIFWEEFEEKIDMARGTIMLIHPNQWYSFRTICYRSYEEIAAKIKYK